MGTPPVYGQPKKSNAGCIIGFAIGLLVLIAAIGGFVAFILKATAPPRDASHAFLGKVRKGEWDAAYRDTSKEYQKTVSREAFEKQLESDLPGVKGSTDATFNSTSITNSQACLSGTLKLASGSEDIHVRLVEEDGGWKIAAISRGFVAGCNK